MLKAETDGRALENNNRRIEEKNNLKKTTGGTTADGALSSLRRVPPSLKSLSLSDCEAQTPTSASIEQNNIFRPLSSLSLFGSLPIWELLFAFSSPPLDGSRS